MIIVEAREDGERPVTLSWSPRLERLIRERIDLYRYEAMSLGVRTAERFTCHPAAVHLLLAHPQAFARPGGWIALSGSDLRVYGLRVAEHSADARHYPLMTYDFTNHGLPQQRIILHCLEATEWEASGSDVVGSKRWRRCPHCSGLLDRDLCSGLRDVSSDAGGDDS